MEAKTTTIVRLIDAPRARVYQAWLTPEDLMQWHFASEGWTTPSAKVDAHVGGKFNIRFQSPDPQVGFDFEGSFDELVESERIVYTIGDGRKVWVEFADEDGKTKVTLTLTLETQHTEEQQREGWGAMVDHLGKYLSK